MILALETQEYENGNFIIFWSNRWISVNRFDFARATLLNNRSLCRFKNKDYRGRSISHQNHVHAHPAVPRILNCDCDNSREQSVLILHFIDILNYANALDLTIHLTIVYTTKYPSLWYQRARMHWQRNTLTYTRDLFYFSLSDAQNASVRRPKWSKPLYRMVCPNEKFSSSISALCYQHCLSTFGMKPWHTSLPALFHLRAHSIPTCNDNIST